MELLIFSQIIFNFTATFVLLLAGILIIVIGYDILKAIGMVKKAARNVNEKSNMLYERLDDSLANLSILPFISRFFKKKKKEE